MVDYHASRRYKEVNILQECNACMHRLYDQLQTLQYKKGKPYIDIIKAKDKNIIETHCEKFELFREEQEVVFQKERSIRCLCDID